MFLTTLVLACGGRSELSLSGYASDSSSLSDGPDVPTVKSIACGINQACAVLTDGTLQCWGLCTESMLGDNGCNGTAPGKLQHPAPITVRGIDPVEAVSIGWNYGCALLGSGTVRCWGNPPGADPNGGSGLWPPALVSEVSGAVAISSGLYQSCAQGLDGSLRCWGNTGYSALDDTRHFILPFGSGVRQFSASDNTCVMVGAGQVYCWGVNLFGQLGNGETGGVVLVPTHVNGVSNATRVSVGARHACAVLSDGNVVCWGSNAHGQLGDDTTRDSNNARLVVGVEHAVTVALGFGHSCALLADGTVKCWGDNRFGALGSSGKPDDTPHPSATPVPGVVRARDICSGYSSYSCALSDKRTISCWGFNGSGQLGDGTTTDRSMPVRVTGY